MSIVGAAAKLKTDVHFHLLTHIVIFVYIYIISTPSSITTNIKMSHREEKAKSTTNDE